MQVDVFQCIEVPMSLCRIGISRVLLRSATSMLTSITRVPELQHRTGAQYSAGAYTRAIVNVHSVGALPSRLVQARRRINPAR